MVGTGGYPLYRMGTSAPSSEGFNGATYGVLKLTLKSGTNDWQFIPVDGQTFRDSGSGSCATSSATLP